MKTADKKIPLKKKLIVELVLALMIIASLFLMPAPDPVTDLAVTGITYDSVSLAWAHEGKADGYHIYRSEAGKDFELVGTVSGTEYHDTGLRTGTEYIYKVKAFKGIRRASSGEAQTVSAKPVLDSPNIDIFTGSGNIELEIFPVDGATSYEIYRDGERIANQGGEIFIDKDADAASPHDYTVRAERRHNGIAYSELSVPVTLALKAPGEIKAVIMGKDIKVSWSGSEDHSDFKLCDGNVLLAETADSEYTIKEFDPDKEYHLRLSACSGGKKSPSQKMDFVLAESEMTNNDAINAACDWGVEIAEDNSFTYGTGKRAHHFGCYFCGNNLEIKGEETVDGHSYDKTYCCNSFVHACFAHGAGDPVLIESCSKGKGIGMTTNTYTRYGCFEYVGKPAYSELKRGDILVANPDMGKSKSNHVVLYLGNGKRVHAARGGWDDASINVSALSAKEYRRRFDFVMRYTGNGRGVKYVIKEI